jgi:hypothetical protein
MASMIPGMLLLWFILTAGSLIFVVWDLLYRTPTMWVMKLAWILIILYAGPIGLVLYLLACREPLRGTHEQFIAAHWKQAVGSMMHCVAGDATGIILAAAVVFHFGLPNGIDIIVEYCAAFVVGLLIFQALFMKSMLGGNYFVAVRKTFFAETVSMNMVMLGMIPVMIILMSRIPGSDDPMQPTFWGVMSLATMVGMVTAYPINSWMVAKGIKHGMMTAPSEKAPAQAAGHEPAMEMGAMGRDESMGQEMSMEQPGSMGQHGSMGHGESMGHQGAEISWTQAVGVFLLTLALFSAAVWITSWCAEIRFS